MSAAGGLFGPSDWDRVKLVVFDVDGTLYDQRPVRLRMAMSLLLHMASGRLRDVRHLALVRRIREELGEEAPEGFEDLMYERACRATGRDRAELEALVSEWLEKRPLPRLRAARAAGVEQLFDGLRRKGYQIGVWSDHPVTDKLAALGLSADHVVAANDPAVGCLKPLPKGLMKIMTEAGAAPHETLMVGDRADRDGEAARRAGVSAILRTKKPVAGFSCFRRYDDPLFDPVLAA